MSPALTGWAGPETPPPTEPYPTRPDPPPSSGSGCPLLEGRRHRALCRPQSPHHHGRRNDGPSVSQLSPISLTAPPPRHQDHWLRDAPAPGTPESWLGALTSEELRAPPRSVRQPLPPPLAPAPPPPLWTGVACPPAADSGPGNPPPRLRLRASHCAVCPSLNSASLVIGQPSASALEIAAHSPPLSPGHTRTHSRQ
ncbi:leucine-rich repeat extensin-like protein 3 [Leopardus geoffroyi]|uniref:leucine-rich repeat extensin-like protein 3 n=1 Tax=Leopardus geoffroyi TaxID=46844 RepID=UPI001E25F564|nr:leucine-rich repeat extensin-like protein 3 [Leopardus geoffroyi]